MLAEVGVGAAGVLSLLLLISVIGCYLRRRRQPPPPTTRADNTTSQRTMPSAGCTVTDNFRYDK